MDLDNGLKLKDDLNEVGFPVGLAIRTGDIFIVEPWAGVPDLSVPTYAVALFEPPALEPLGVPVSPVALPQGVVAAGVTADGWGWISLEPHTKDYLGELLVSAGAKLGQWFKLTITYGNPLEATDGQD